MTAFEIPLIAAPQTLSVSLAGSTYNLRVLWNAIAGYWVLDIADSANNRLLSGIPLVTGLDLLGPYAYLNIGGAMYVQSDSSPLDAPTYDNLGTGSHLYFVTPA